MAEVARLPNSAAPVPPQNLDAEESVLGAMMLSPGAIGAVSEILDAGDFYRESHATVYRAPRLRQARRDDRSRRPGRADRLRPVAAAGLKRVRPHRLAPEGLVRAHH